MAYVPGGLTFPKYFHFLQSESEDTTATVDNAYWIGETEVTYELWKKVYDWATHSERGAKKYEFVYPGRMGSKEDGTDMTVKHPVTYITWYDCLVWCNALTEWYNAKKGTSYDCVYIYEDKVIRNSNSLNVTVLKNVNISSTGKGFRLLGTDEWELAARYRGSDTTNVVTGVVNGVNFDEMEIKWTKGNSASGDTQAVNAIPSTAGHYAVFNPDAGGKTAAVKTKLPNALGLFDMSGNVEELCYEWHPVSTNYKILRGESYIGVYRGIRDMSSIAEIYNKYDSVGFRIAQNDE